MNLDIIFRFLLDPIDQKRFKAFFDVCYLIAKGYIYKLKDSGYPIPITDSDINKTLDNLTVSILSGLLSPSGNWPCYIVFDYFKRHNIHLDDKADKNEIIRHFRILLLGYIKRELPKVIGAEKPQQLQLKRTIRIILAKDPFEKKEIKNKKYVFLKKFLNELFELNKTIDNDLTLRILNEIYPDTNTYVDICNSFFIQLHSYEEYRNFIEYHPFVQTVVNFFESRIELDYTTHGDIITPERQYIRSQADKASDIALEYIESNCIDEFIQKGRIASSEKEPIMKALKLFIRDYSYDGSHDLLPKYFKSAMPAELYQRYHKDYRYIFETLVQKVKEKFKDLLKNDLKNRF